MLQRKELPRAQRRKTIAGLLQHRTLTRQLIDAGGGDNIQPNTLMSETDLQIKRGMVISEEARGELIRSNLGIVITVARKYTGRGLAFGELMQEGHIGLMLATDRFDYKRGFRFATYAAWWVRSMIGRALEKTANAIRIPNYVLSMQRRLNTASNRLSLRYGITPSAVDLARDLDIPTETVDRFSGITRQPLSLDLPQKGTDDETIGDSVADHEVALAEDIVVAREMSEHVVKLLNILPIREREMLRLRFGIGKERGYTLKEVGNQYGLSRERIRQIESIALKKLRDAYKHESMARSPTVQRADIVKYGASNHSDQDA